LVIEISLYYDAWSKKHPSKMQIVFYVCIVKTGNDLISSVN